jgi:hypothetical protein
VSRPVAKTDTRGAATLLAVLLAGVSAVAAPLAGQGEPGRVDFQVQGLATVYDNFFRVGDGLPQERVFSWTTAARATLRLDRDERIEVFGEAEQTFFEEMGGSHGFGGGVRLGRHPHVLRFRARYLDAWPAWDVGDVVQTADVIRAHGSYTYRISPDWVVGASGHATSVRFTDPDLGDSRLYGLGGRLRYRGLTYRVQPEVGAELDVRRADDPNQAEQRVRLVASLVLMPVDELWMVVRYRRRSREFTRAEPASVNFGRSDEGGQWVVDSSLSVSSHLHLSLRYEFIDMRSDLPTQTHSAQVLTLGTTVRF